MSVDEKTRFPPLNDDNYTEWSIRMEAELIRKSLWDNVQCEVSVEGKTTDEAKEVVTKWRGKRTQKKMAETCAEIILRVEDSQLAHIRTRDPETLWGNLLQVHRARGLATRLALRRKFLTSVKGADAMSAWIGRVKAMAFRLTEIGVAVTDEDQILALTMGLDASYEPFVISLDSTQPELLTLDYVIHRLLNEDVRRDNQEKGKVSNGNKEVKVKKDKDNVAFAAVANDSPRVCWRCGKTGHIKAFCKEKPIRGRESEQANVVLSATDADDADIWLDEVSQHSDSDI
jgi:hypothetical protein